VTKGCRKKAEIHEFIELISARLEQYGAFAVVLFGHARSNRPV